MNQPIEDQFLFFCVNIGIENLLKEEIKTFYPELTLSYSRKGFLTYKNKGVRYDLSTISELQVTFATRSGLCLGKSRPEEILETIETKFKECNTSLDDCLIHNYSINNDYHFDAESCFKQDVNTYSSDGKLVLNLIALSDNEIWFGLHRVSKGVTRYPNGNAQVNIPKTAPSIAYIKLAEIKELFSLKFDHKDLWLDFGCSPGGSTAYLLSTGAKVWGIDTAPISKTILAKSNFKYIKASVQDLTQEELPDQRISWVHVDININPKQAIKEVLRLCKKYNQSLRGMVFTIQIVRPEYVHSIQEFEDIFYDWGFSYMISRQVPSHKKEYALIAQRRVKSES